MNLILGDSIFVSLVTTRKNLIKRYIYATFWKFEKKLANEIFCLQLSRFRSGAIATGSAAGPIDPGDLSQRLSSLPLDREGEEEEEGEGEGESAPLFGASGGIRLQ